MLGQVLQVVTCSFGIYLHGLSGSLGTMRLVGKHLIDQFFGVIRKSESCLIGLLGARVLCQGIDSVGASGLHVLSISSEPVQCLGDCR